MTAEEEPIGYNQKDWIVLSIMLLFLFLEIKYMWVWCQLFTNCLK